MRIFRLIVLLLSVLALNTHALTAVARVSALPASKTMSMHADTDNMQQIQAGANDDTHMDCCDPGAKRQPCAPDKDDACLCKLGHGCQSQQWSDSIATLSFFIPMTAFVPHTKGTTVCLSRRISPLLRPPIR
jgi:hypothetical protein